MSMLWRATQRTVGANAGMGVGVTRMGATCGLWGQEARRHFRASAPAAHDEISFLHIDTPYNNESTPFDFTDENYEEAKRIIAKYPPNYRQAAAIPLLHLAQKQNNNWLPLAAMNKVAKIIGMDEPRLFEVVTFYTMFNRHPVGKHELLLCTTTPCQLGGCGSDVVLATIKSHLGIEVGETTADGLFTLKEVECLGACVNAPVMRIADYYYEDLDPKSIVAILDKMRKGEEVKPGPQSGLRGNCEGPQGRTTLLTPPPGPAAPNLPSQS